MSDNKINPKDFEIKEENKEDFKETVIERKNVVTEFTVGVVEEHKADLEKFGRELTSQIGLCQGTIDNMLKNHEWLKDLDDEKLHHAWMLKSNMDVITEAEPKLKQVEDQLGQYNDLLDTVYDRFGFVKSEVATPAVEPKDES